MEFPIIIIPFIMPVSLFKMIVFIKLVLRSLTTNKKTFCFLIAQYFVESKFITNLCIIYISYIFLKVKKMFISHHRLAHCFVYFWL